MVRNAFHLSVFLLCGYIAIAQGRPPLFDKGYSFKKSTSIIQDKNFYLLTLLETTPVWNRIAADTLLNTIRNIKINTIENVFKRCGDSIPCFIQNLFWTSGEIKQVGNALIEQYSKNEPVRNIVKDMRRSGYFILYHQMTDRELLLQAWEDAAAGMNNIIRTYSMNTGLRYGKIDSITYPLNSTYYRTLYREMFAQVKESKQRMKLFFHPVLKVTMELLFINNRDEAARYEPLNLKENNKALQRAAGISWNKYPYAVILVPGEGPENQMPISPNTKYRCRLAAERFKKGAAPFLIVSGGHVHPAQTNYCEAIEMKKYLVEECSVPDNAIIIEPHARHTTTNFRNATRIMARAGIPTNVKSLCSTSIFQADYIISESFKKINMDYLKYLPFISLKRLNDFDIEFVPNLLSLHMDSLDPLDP